MKKIKYIKCSECGNTFTLWEDIFNSIYSKKKYCSVCRKEYCKETSLSIEIINVDQNIKKYGKKAIDIYEFVISLATAALAIEKTEFYNKNKIIGIKKKNKVVQKNGYVNVKINDRWELEHRIVAEEKIGRKLGKDEIVHHINGITWENQKENLMVLTKKEHAKYHSRKK